MRGRIAPSFESAGNDKARVREGARFCAAVERRPDCVSPQI